MIRHLVTDLDLGLPGLRAHRAVHPLLRVHGGHVPGQHGARPQPAHAPVVPERLHVVDEAGGAVAAVEVVGLPSSTVGRSISCLALILCHRANESYR